MLIKYNNRKIYDKNLSQYVTIDDLFKRIREGEEVQVFDKETNKDVTKKVLLQGLSKLTLSYSELTELIKKGNNNDLE